MKEDLEIMDYFKVPIDFSPGGLWKSTKIRMDCLIIKIPNWHLSHTVALFNKDLPAVEIT
jgi:hypothetical protein